MVPPSLVLTRPLLNQGVGHKSLSKNQSVTRVRRVSQSLPQGGGDFAVKSNLKFCGNFAEFCGILRNFAEILRYIKATPLVCLTVFYCIFKQFWGLLMQPIWKKFDLKQNGGEIVISLAYPKEPQRPFG